MPEGPEVRRSADRLFKSLATKKLRKVEVHGGRYAQKPPEGTDELNRVLKEADGMRIDQIDCKGKFMFWTFFPGWVMWCTYGMSGQWFQGEPDKHTAVSLWIEHGGKLERWCFRDPRHFGTLKFVHDPDDSVTKKKLATLGPDMLHNPPDERTFRVELLRKNQKTLAEALMDQSVVSGVGNYVKAEALYLAELSPHRVIRDLSTQEIERLRVQIINVMKASYNTGGATISTYRNVDGTKGGAQRRFAVYGNQTDPMGNPVVREETKDGRTTHWVPSVQK